MMPNLTLLIIAYNRPRELSRLLNSILYALDNCPSDLCNLSIILAYNEPLPQTRNPILDSIIQHPVLYSFKLLSRPHNIMLDSHLSLCYNDCVVGYIWFLSDDDIISVSSLAYVASLIEKIYFRPEFQVKPPIYLNWTTQDSLSTASLQQPPVFKKLSLFEFSSLERSTFFLSATVVHKDNKSSCLRVFDGFTHFSCLLSQVLSAKCILVSDEPVVGFDPQCSYTESWLYLFLISLPTMFDYYSSLGVNPSLISNIFRTSLVNLTGYSTIFLLASKQSLASRLFYLSSVFHWARFYPFSFRLVAPFLFLLAPFFVPFKTVLRLFK